MYYSIKHKSDQTVGTTAGDRDTSWAARGDEAVVALHVTTQVEEVGTGGESGCAVQSGVAVQPELDQESKSVEADGDGSGDGIAGDVQLAEEAHVADTGGDGASQAIVGDVEVLDEHEVADADWELAGDSRVLRLEVLEVGQVADGGLEGTSEGVVVEVEGLQVGDAGHVRAELAGEAEGGEVHAHDDTAGVAGDTGPGADARGRVPVGGGRPSGTSVGVVYG